MLSIIAMLITLIFLIKAILNIIPLNLSSEWLVVIVCLSWYLVYWKLKGFTLFFDLFLMFYKLMASSSIYNNLCAIFWWGRRRILCLTRLKIIFNLRFFFYLKTRLWLFQSWHQQRVILVVNVFQFLCFILAHFWW